MEIRLRSAVSRNAKGYSIEATLDMGSDVPAPGGLIPPDMVEFMIDNLSSVQLAKLQEHLAKLGAVFPREEEA